MIKIPRLEDFKYSKKEKLNLMRSDLKTLEKEGEFFFATQELDLKMRKLQQNIKGLKAEIKNERNEEQVSKQITIEDVIERRA